MPPVKPTLTDFNPRISVLAKERAKGVGLENVEKIEGCIGPFVVIIAIHACVNTSDYA